MRLADSPHHPFGNGLGLNIVSDGGLVNKYSLSLRQTRKIKSSVDFSMMTAPNVSSKKLLNDAYPLETVAKK